jgi:preprotein translocase subunit Sss1
MLFLWIQGWLNSPFLGAGFGAVTEIQRSQDMPWAYELTYLAVLFQTGAVGFTIYLMGILWIAWHLITIMRDHTSSVRIIAFGMLNGMIGFLIGSASDPYLLAFDYLWVLFMPIGLINLELMRTDRELRDRRAS